MLPVALYGMMKVKRVNRRLIPRKILEIHRDVDVVRTKHLSDVTWASQSTGKSTVLSTVYPGLQQRKHQSSALLILASHKGAVMHKVFQYHGVVMILIINTEANQCHLIHATAFYSYSSRGQRPRRLPSLGRSISDNLRRNPSNK